MGLVMGLYTAFFTTDEDEEVPAVTLEVLGGFGGTTIGAFFTYPVELATATLFSSAAFERKFLADYKNNKQ